MSNRIQAMQNILENIQSREIFLKFLRDEYYESQAVFEVCKMFYIKFFPT